MKQGLLFFVGLWCAFFILGCTDRPQQQSIPPQVERGDLDLSGWNFTEQGVIKLSGNWEFYWNQLLTPEAVQEGKGTIIRYLDTPGYWNNKTLDNKQLSSFGYATYRVQIHHNSVEPLGIQLPNISTAYKLWVNGELKASSGHVGSSRDTSVPHSRHNTVFLDPKTSPIDLLFQVSNFHHRASGIGKQIILGTSDQILQRIQSNLSLELFLLGSMLIIGLYHVGFYIVRRKELGMLFFGLYCLCYGIRSPFVGSGLAFSAFPNLNWEFALKVEYLTLYGALLFFIHFIKEIYPQDVSKYFIKPYSIAIALLAALALVTPARIYSHSLNIFMFLTATTALYILYILIRAVVYDREGSRLFCLGGVILFGTVINDMLYQYKVVYTGEFVGIGVFAFILSQAFLLSFRLSRAFAASETLSDRLLAVDKLRDEFLANTSHELRTPINGIVGLSESLLDGAGGTVTESQGFSLELISQSGRRLSRLIDDILDFSKLKNHDLQLHIAPVDIHSIADIVIRLSAPLTEGKPIKFSNELTETLPMVMGDENRLQQILLNIVGNAIKFTHAGEVKVSAREDGRYLRIMVSDTGIGIPKEKHEAIFRSFEQADGSTTREYGGAGLGLSISKQLIELHGGLIELESESGKGTTVSILIPTERSGEQTTEPKTTSPIVNQDEGSIIGLDTSKPAEETEAATENSSEEPAHEGMDGDQETVLIVDDETINIQVLKNLLDLRNYRVLTATNGHQALEVLETEEPDIAIIDVMMPRMSGYELCQKIRETFDSSQMPILMLSAKNQVTDLVEGLRNGANDYLTKPFYKEELLARLHMQTQLKKSIETMKESERKTMELRTAKLVQSLLIPKEDPILDEIEISSFYRSASETGGDWYGYQYRPEQQTLDVLIGDVTGHGVPAAIITAMVNSFYHVIEEHRQRMHDQKHQEPHLIDPTYLLGLLNDVLHDVTGGLYNMTFFYSVLDLNTKVLTYVSAGHNPCYIWRPEKFKVQKKNKVIEKSVTSINTCSPTLGYAKNSVYEVQTQQLQSDDVILWYTDGLIENESTQKEMYGPQRLRRTLQKVDGLDVHQIKEMIIEDAYQHYGEEPPDDDVALIVGRIK